MRGFYFIAYLAFFYVGMQIVYLVASLIFGISTRLTGNSRLIRFTLYSAVALIIAAAIQAVIGQSISGFPDGKPAPLTPQVWASNFRGYLLASLIFLPFGVLSFYAGVFIKSLTNRVRSSQSRPN